MRFFIFQSAEQAGNASHLVLQNNTYFLNCILTRRTRGNILALSSFIKHFNKSNLLIGEADA
ncbi:hypothetical protein PAAL66ix_25545 [Paenibacillus alvei A6-6i-x]|nr:hypothetical protein PAAL66ix_25545 [Paenibacillus alvei A6-6i-x]